MLSAHAALRPEVVPAEPTSCGSLGDARPLALDLGDDSLDDDEPARNPWAWLLRHVFLQDVTVCDRCGGPMRWVEVATTREAAERLLALERGDVAAAPPARAPPRAKTRAPAGQTGFGFGE